MTMPPITQPPIHIIPAAGDLWSFGIDRYPPLPPPHDKTWTRTFGIDCNGQAEFDGSITVSGRHVETPDAAGYYRVRRPIPGNYMGGFWSDLSEGPALVCRGNIFEGAVGSHPFSVIDDATGEECARIENDGTVRCKSVETQDGVNGVFRIGPAVVTLKGGRVMKVEGVQPQ